MTGPIIDPYAYPPRGLDRAAAARYLALPPDTFSALVQVGTLPQPRQLGGIAVWDRNELDAAFKALPAAGRLAPEPAFRPMMSEQWPGYHATYTPKTLAQRWKCSAHLVRNEIRRGRLSAFRYGGKLFRISAAEVVAYETANMVKPPI